VVHEVELLFSRLGVADAVPNTKQAIQMRTAVPENLLAGSRIVDISFPPLGSCSALSS